MRPCILAGGFYMSSEVRLGLMGAGGMGSYHAGYITAGKIKGCCLSAVFDIDQSKLDSFEDVAKFTDSGELMRSGLVDAVLIATPHYFHTSMGIEALENGLHVLVEKPISVHKADCLRLIAAHKNEKQVFSAMFNMRTVPIYNKVKQLIETGELGEMTRVNWIVTNWFRTDAYYASGGWRATWKGEGGGVLLNQCPHQLDLLQWMTGMPSKIRAFCGFGVRHDIEVEDQVTAYMEYPNGATGVFITSTGEAPGTNRLEITGERGKIVVEDSQLKFIRNEVPMTEFSRAATDGFAQPAVWNIEIPSLGECGAHENITQNFVDAILNGTPLIAPGEEGIKSVELANAMLYSTLINDTVDMPLDAEAYEVALQKLIDNSKFVKKSVKETVSNFSGSFNKV